MANGDGDAPGAPDWLPQFPFPRPAEPPRDRDRDVDDTSFPLDEFGDPIEPPREGMPNVEDENLPEEGAPGEPPLVFQPGPPIIYGPGPPVLFGPGPPVRPSERPNPRNPGGVSDEILRQMRPRTGGPQPQASLPGRRRRADPRLPRQARQIPRQGGPLPNALRPSSAPRASARRGMARRPAPRFGFAGGALSFRGPRPARPLPREDQPIVIRRTSPFPDPLQREAERRRRQREIDRFRRGIPGTPTPAPYPVIPPPRRVVPSPPATPAPPMQPVPPLPDRRLAVPQPQIPAPAPPTVEIPPLGAPPAPVMRPPRAPTVPRSRPRAPSRPARVLQRVGSGLAAASILRPIFRRKSRQTAGLSRFQLADAVLNRPGDEIGTIPATRVSPEPAISPALDLRDLTPVQPTALGLSQAVTPQTRRDECVCEETEEEKEEKRERNRSNVVARVKAFSRRMSQNSLDNLRKG